MRLFVSEDYYYLPHETTTPTTTSDTATTATTITRLLSIPKKMDENEI